MMVRELNQSLPIYFMLKNLLDARRPVSIRIVPTAGQKQVHLGTENTGVQRSWCAEAGWRGMSQRS